MPSPSLLYVLSVLGSGAGFMTQMLVSGFWTTAFSHDVTYFSVNVAIYFLSLGLGSLLSKKITKPKLVHVAGCVVALGMWVGLCIPFLRFGLGVIPKDSQIPVVILPVLAVLIAGSLSGMVIPLVLRVANKKIDLPTLFFLDYSAAIAFTLFFTFVLLVPLGYGKTALFLSISCTSATAALLLWAREYLPKLFVAMFFALLLPSISFLSSQKNGSGILQGKGKILYKEQSHYQKIVMTQEKTDDPYLGVSYQHVLYLDGFLQFSTLDEQRYHFCITNIPIAAAEYNHAPATKALVLGGGDGLVVRNLTAIRTLQKITEVELDPAMIRLAKTHPLFLKYNLNSLADPRVEVIAGDAFRWIGETAEKYDVVIIDFPQPKNLSLARLYSAEFYAKLKRILKPKSFVAIQAGPSFSRSDPTLYTLSEVTASILVTLESVGMRAFPYTTPRDAEAFVLATPDPNFNMLEYAKQVGIYQQLGLGQLCTFNNQWKRPNVEKNTLNTLKLSQYMIDWFTQAGKPFFNFQGTYTIFLPD